ncbi:MAG: InlB B-repeat-containing protein [Firmicutes bacterium]|nr:InlB B-repeat-containing protein [Bacillota bacterium]
MKRKLTVLSLLLVAILAIGALAACEGKFDQDTPEGVTKNYLDAVQKMDVERTEGLMFFVNDAQKEAFLNGALGIAVYWPQWKEAGVKMTIKFKSYEKLWGDETREQGKAVYSVVYVGTFGGTDMSMLNNDNEVKILDYRKIDGKWYLGTEFFIVTFNTDGGGTVAPQFLASGGKVTEPLAEPTKDGFLFDGWYADSAKTAEFNFETTLIRDNTTIFAKWKVDDREFAEVTFNTKGGTAIAPVSVEKGEKVAKPAADPTKTGFDFKGWYTSAALTTVFDFETTEINADTIVYAKWEAKLDTIENTLRAYLDALADLDAVAGLNTFHFASEDDRAAYLGSAMTSIATLWPTWALYDVTAVTVFKSYAKISGTDTTETGTLTYDATYTGIMAAYSGTDIQAVMNFVKVEGKWYISPAIPQA